MRLRLHLIALAAVGLVASGCANNPPASDALAQARQAYANAQADPHVAQYASMELQQAGRTLNSAEQLAQDNASVGRVGHLAYLAEQQAHIARYTASARASDAELARAHELRERVVLEARAREAQAAQMQAQERAREAQAAARAAERERVAALQAQATLGGRLEELQSRIAEMQARKTERGLVVTLGADVLFDTGQASLKPGARNALDNFARALSDEKPQRIIIEGFTDSTGSTELNQRLSEDRAQAVKNALVQSGMPPERIVTRGMGEAYPVASNDTSAGRQLNRRVEIIVPDSEPRADGQ